MNYAFSASLRKRLYIWLTLSSFSALTICIFSTYVYSLWITIAEFAFFALKTQSSKINSFHERNHCTLFIFSLGTLSSISGLVYYSYYFLYNLYTCRADSQRTITFVLKDCSLALVTVFVSATAFAQFFESFSGGGNSEVKLLMVLNCQWLAEYSVLKTLIAVFCVIYYHSRIRSGTSEVCFSGSSVYVLQGVRLQSLSELSAWSKKGFSWSLMATKALSIAFDCISSSAVASGLYVVISALIPMSQSMTIVARDNLLRQLAGVFVAGMSVFVMSYFLSLLLCWLHLTFQFIVLTHPMDFSLLAPNSSKESLLIESLTLGLCPVITGAEGPHFSSFVACAKSAIAARFPQPSSLSLPAPLSLLFDEAAALLGEPEWLRAISLMAEFRSVLESETTRSAAVPLLLGVGGVFPSASLSLAKQHCRALAFQDLCRLASAGPSDKASKSRRASLFRGGVPSIIFACCAVIHAAALQVSLLKKRLDDRESRAKAAPTDSKNFLPASVPSPVFRFWTGLASRLSLVGLLAGSACQLLLRACSSWSTSSSRTSSASESQLVIWVASAAAAVSAMVATGLLLWFVAAERRRTTTPPIAKAGRSNPPNKEQASQTPREGSSIVTQTIAPLLARLLGLDFLTHAVPISAITSQMVCHAVEGMVSLLLVALAEDESGGSHRYAACAMDALLQLRSAVEEFSSALLHSGSFQCSLPTARKSNRFAAPHGIDPTGAQFVRYKLHSSWSPSLSSSSSLSPQLQEVLACVQKATEQLVRGYSDVLQLNYLYNQKNKRGFSSPVLSEAMKQTFHAMGTAAQ